MHRRRRILFFVIPPLFFLFVALGVFVVQQLWNGLLPALFGWPRVSFWQALGLLALCRILFGGISFSDSGGSSRRRRLERWRAMTPEEQERYRQSWRGRWFGAPVAEGQEP